MIRPCVCATVVGCVLACGTLAHGQVLLIPDSGNDRIWAFDPFDGQLISNNFIPTHPSLAQPINAIDSGRGTILVSDEVNDSVQEFNYNGTYVGVFADASTGLDGPFGLTRSGGNVYVTSNVNGRVMRYNDDGSAPTIWASGFGTPRDIVFRASDVLITESAGDDILRFDLSGSLLGTWHNSDGVSGIDFPQQMQVTSTGGALVAGFTAPFGLYEYDAAGAQIAAYTNLITSPRGVYRLGDGKLLYSGGTRVMVYDPTTATESTVVNEPGTSFRFIEFSQVPSPGAVTLLGAAGILAARRRSRQS